MRNNSNQGQDYNTLIEKVRQSRISLNSSENATSSSSAAANSGMIQMFASTAAVIGTNLAEFVSRSSSRSNSPAISNNVLEFQNDEVRQTVGEIVNKLLIIAEGYNSTSPIADLRKMLGYKEEGDVFQMNMADNFHYPEIRNKRDAFRIIIQNLDLIDRELFQDDTARDRLRNILTTKTNSTEALDPTDLGKLYLRTVKDEVDVGQIPENHRKQIVKDNNDLLKRENDLSKLSNDLSQYQSLANEFIEESFKAFFQFEDIASEESKSGRVKRTHETFAKNLSSVMAKIVAENEGETNQSEAEIIRRYSGIPIETIAAKIESKLPEIEERLKITYTVLAKEKKREENPDQEELTAEEKQKTEEEAKEAAQRFIEREFNFHNQLKKLTSQKAVLYFQKLMFLILFYQHCSLFWKLLPEALGNVFGLLEKNLCILRYHHLAAVLTEFLSLLPCTTHWFS